MQPPGTSHLRSRFAGRGHLGRTEYALVAGAVAGGGLTVIANAPNPAGVGILQSAKVFEDEGIIALGLFLGALPPTVAAIVLLWWLP